VKDEVVNSEIVVGFVSPLLSASRERNLTYNKQPRGNGPCSDLAKPMVGRSWWRLNSASVVRVELATAVTSGRNLVVDVRRKGTKMSNFFDGLAAFVSILFVVSR
jgi:hypothetical protein